MKVMVMITELIFGKLMKKTLIIASVLMAMIFAGCSQEDIVTKSQTLPESNQVTLTISAVTKNPDVNSEAQTRIAYGTTDATWETGDKIFLVKSDGTTITLTLSDGAGTTSGTFTSTDAVVAGTYTPYAVSATSITKGFVSIAAGEITLNLSAPGGGTLADALEHDILKGDAVTLTDDQATASITGLTTHMLSYLRFRFSATSKAISTIGMSSTGGVYRTVTIASDGTVSGSASSTDAVSVTAGNDGANNYTGYFAVYGSTTTSLVAHAEDADGGKYSRLVSVKDANYTAGTVYGKSFTLSDAMMTAAATGQLSSQNWKNLGLSVKWAEFNVGSSSEYSYDRNVFNVSHNEGGMSVPAGWSGWRIPTRAEVQELFYASNRQWVTGATNGVKFNCNGRYVAMGAGGRYRIRTNDLKDWDFNVGETVFFYINECTSSNGAYAQYWASIGSEGTTLGFDYDDLGARQHPCSNSNAMRLVCDY